MFQPWSESSEPGMETRPTAIRRRPPPLANRWAGLELRFAGRGTPALSSIS